jgi:methylated-DNA-protein-cysteine methyltransferase-like protein
MDYMTTYQKIYKIVRNIPTGKVMTYGQIAKMVSNCTPRMVGYAMAALSSGSDIPWQRVINSQGKVSLRSYGENELQQKLLEGEGIHFDKNHKLDLLEYRWIPEL